MLPQLVDRRGVDAVLEACSVFTGSEHEPGAELVAEQIAQFAKSSEVLRNNLAACFDFEANDRAVVRLDDAIDFSVIVGTPMRGLAYVVMPTGLLE